MGTRNRENRAVSGLIALTAVLAIGVLLFVFLSYTRAVRENREMAALVAESGEALAAKEEKVAALQQEIDTFRNYQDKIAEEKQLFFEKALELETKVLNGESDVRIAYFTFDDGPYWDTSHIFLDILDEYDIKATFFYLEKDDHDDIYQRVLDSGHTLANHTASHRLGAGGIYRSTEAFLADVKENRDYIEEKFGYTTNIMRFPGGSPTAGALKPSIVEGLREMGYGYVDWDNTTGDGSNSGTVDEYIHGVLDNLEGQKVMVVLMHDYSVNTYIALPTIIDGLREEGFIFLPLFYESAKIRK